MNRFWYEMPRPLPSEVRYGGINEEIQPVSHFASSMAQFEIEPGQARGKNQPKSNQITEFRVLVPRI